MTLNLMQFFVGSFFTAGAIFAFLSVVAYLDGPMRRAAHKPDRDVSIASDKRAGRRG